MQPSAPAPLPVGTRVVAGAFLASGVVHLVAPRVFEPLVPDALGPPTPWIVGSGVAELVCGGGLVARRRWAPLAGAGLLLAVWPGNWTYTVAVQRSSRAPGWLKTAAWVRLPLQLPLVAWALRSPTHHADGPTC